VARGRPADCAVRASGIGKLVLISGNNFRAVNLRHIKKEWLHMTFQHLNEETPITLFSGPLSLFGAKAEIALREKGLAFRTVMVNFSESDGYEPKHPTVSRINPKHQVPVLIDDQVELFDSTQIFEYLEDLAPAPALWPRHSAARAKARQLELIADEVYFPQVVKLFELQNDRSGQPAQAAYRIMERYHNELENRLSSSEFLAGDFSYADIAFFMVLLFGDRMGGPINERLTKLLNWRKRMAGRTSVKETLVPMKNYLDSVARYFPNWVETYGTD
jgi:glutathione S-transferase